MSREQPPTHPRFGLSAKQELLRIAAGEDSDEEYETSSQQLHSPTTNPHTTDTIDDTKSKSKGELTVTEAAAALKQGSTYFAAIDVKLRPIAPFIARPRLPRVVRQRLLDRLFGQHLALLGHTLGGLQPEVIANNQVLREQAFSMSLAQEASVYEKCMSGQTYQNLAARTNATDWKQQRLDLVPLEEATDTTNTLTKDAKKAKKISTTALPQSAEEIYGKLLADEAKRKQEEQRRREQQQQRELNIHHKRQKVGGYHIPPKQSAIPQLDNNNNNNNNTIAVTAAVTVGGNNNKKVVGELEEVDIFLEPNIPHDSPQVPSPLPPLLETTEGNSLGEERLQKFLEETVSKLIRQGDIDAKHKLLLMSKCTVKVLERHKGQIADDIVEKERESVQRLVGKYAEHIKITYK